MTMPINRPYQGVWACWLPKVHVALMRGDRAVAIEGHIDVFGKGLPPKPGIGPVPG